MSAGQVVARPDLAQSRDREDGEATRWRCVGVRDGHAGRRSPAAARGRARGSARVEEQRRQGGGVVGRVHDGGGHDAAHPAGLDRGGRGGVGVVDDEGAGERRRRAGPRRRRSARGRAPPSAGRPDPSRRHRRRWGRRPRLAPVGPPARRRCPARPGRDRSTRWGSTGRRPRPRRRRWRRAPREPGRAALGAVEAHRLDGHVVTAADEVLLEGDLGAVREGQPRADGIVGHRQQPDRHAEGPGDLGGHLRQRRPRRQALGPVEVGGQVAGRRGGTRSRRRGARGCP